VIIVSTDRFDAIILDLDGVITRTAATHARAWKRMFDEYLERRNREHGESHSPFDIDDDYARYLDGKPRYEGVRSFLQSRGIQLPYGDPADPPDRETVCGLGNRKNELFQELVRTDGVEVFDDTVEMIHRWKQRGLKLAVVSSSRNCAALLEAAGLTSLFDAKIDGLDAPRLGLKGKPHPFITLQPSNIQETGRG
jgi:beta-phosphoglucomutase-like phosphatase (HAD superfamily)